MAGMKCMVLADGMDSDVSLCLNMKTKQEGGKCFTIVVGKTHKSKRVGRDNKTDG